MEPVDRLESWKEIATYLKRDVRTVQRWEAFEALPVHRHQHKKRGSVYALRGELDAWRESRREELFIEPAEDATGVSSERPASRLRGLWTAAALAAAVSAMVLSMLGGPTDLGPLPRSGRDAPRVLGVVTSDAATINRIPLVAKTARLAMSPDGRTLFAAVCRDDGTSALQVIDPVSRVTIWSVDRFGSCTTILLSEDGDRLITGDGSDLIILDTRSRRLRRIPTPAAELRGMVLARDQRRLYAAAVFKGLLEIDTDSGAVSTTSALPCPVALAINPGRGRLYVNYQCSGPGGSRGHDALEVFDTETSMSIRSITDLPNVGGHLALSPDGAQLWADGSDACLSSYYDGAGCPPGRGAVVNVIRTADHSLLRSLRVGGEREFNTGLSFTPDGSRVVAGRTETSVVSSTTLTTMESWPAPLWSNVVFGPDGQTAYAVLGEEGSIAVLPIATRPAPPAGATARWTADGVRTDAAGGNDLPAGTAPVFVAGRVGQAFEVDAVASLRIPVPTHLDIDRGLMTAMAWVKLTRPGTVLEYAMRDLNGEAGWQLLVDDESRPVVCIGAFDGTGCSSQARRVIADTSISPDAWHHIAFTRSEQSIILFVDGRVAGQALGLRPAFPIQDVGWLRFGSNQAGTQPLTGRIDEIEIYNRPLTPEEIAERGK